MAAVDVNAPPMLLADYLKVVNDYLDHDYLDHSEKREAMGLSGGLIRSTVFQLLVLECGRPAPAKAGTAARFAACLYTLFVTQHLALQQRRILGFEAEFVYETACNVCSRLDGQAALIDAVALVDQTGLAQWMIQQPGQLEALFSGSRAGRSSTAAKRKRAPKEQASPKPAKGQASPKPANGQASRKPAKKHASPKPPKKLATTATVVTAAVVTAAASSRPSRPSSPATTTDTPFEPWAIDIEVDSTADLWVDAVFDAPLLDLSRDDAMASELTPDVI